MQIDLHCHSTISDGTFSPQELVAHANKQGVKVMALTDHDAVEGLQLARTTAESLGMAFINGIEISATWKKRTLHIVGLKIDPTNVPLLIALKQVRLDRETRAQQMGLGLMKVGIHGAYEGAKAIAGNSILTRSHFAQFLVEAGHVKDVKTVFKKYLVKGKPGFVDQSWMSMENAVKLIIGAGGTPVIAHPGRYDLGMINMHLLMHEFRSHGGVAIEVVTSSHNPPQYQQFAKIAHKFDLKSSQGSDYHGPNRTYMDMGRLPALPAECVPVWQDWPEAAYLN